MLDVAESECGGRRRWAMVERCSLRQMPVAIADRIDALYLLAAQSPERHRQSYASTPPTGAARARCCRGRLDVVAINAQAIAVYIAQGAPSGPLHQ
jgi:hypothetical protein